MTDFFMERVHYYLFFVHERNIKMRNTIRSDLLKTIVIGLVGVYLLIFSY